MLPMLLITCGQEGIVSLNGAFAGEVRPDAPLLRPVNAYGALYIGFTPLNPGAYSFARRVALSAGKPVAAAFQGLNNLSAISWPFGVTEVELLPPRYAPGGAEVTAFSGAGWIMRLVREGERAQVEIAAAGRNYTYPLPDGAETPAIAENEGQLFLSGKTETGQSYVLVLSAAGDRLLLSALGEEIVFLGGRRVAVARAVGDAAGHLRRVVFSDAGEGYKPESEEILASPRSAFQPANPLSCALAAAEAFQLGLTRESQALFAPGFQMSPESQALLSATASCAPLRFSPPDGRSAIAALRAENAALAVALPLYYTAELLGGAWRLTSLTVE